MVLNPSFWLIIVSLVNRVSFDDRGIDKKRVKERLAILVDRDLFLDGLLALFASFCEIAVQVLCGERLGCVRARDNTNLGRCEERVDGRNEGRITERDRKCKRSLVGSVFSVE